MSSTTSETSETSSNFENDYYIYKVYDENGKFYCPVSKENYATKVLLSQKKLNFYNQYFGKSKEVKICLVKSIGKENSLSKAKYYRDLYVIAHQKEICKMKAKVSDSANSDTSKVKKWKQKDPLYQLSSAIKKLDITKKDISELIIYNQQKKKDRMDAPVYDRNRISHEDMEKYKEKFLNFDGKTIAKKEDIYYCTDCVMFMHMNNRIRHNGTKNHLTNCKGTGGPGGSEGTHIQPIMVD